jgi:hypothetical protein
MAVVILITAITAGTVILVTMGTTVRGTILATLVAMTTILAGQRMVTTTTDTVTIPTTPTRPIPAKAAATTAPATTVTGPRTTVGHKDLAATKR